MAAEQIELEHSDHPPPNNDIEAPAKTKKLRYPFSVFFIVGNEFCERFNYYGMRTILSIYLVNKLAYSQEDATVIFHTFSMFVYFFPIIGAIISDSWLGKFNTIFYVSMIYAAGSIVLALASTDQLHLPMTEFSILGLALIAIGTGGIKPCVAAFGGDQFVLPQQEKQLATFFFVFYFSINAGSLISTFLTPVLREIPCLEQDSCYPLAFSVPGALMITSLVIFGIGRPMYKIKKPEGNIVVQVSKCIGHAVAKKIRTKEKKEHWLDHAEERFGKELIRDIKATLKVLVLYLPLPIFWALYDQQGSAWTFQAIRMNGDIGFYTILPDQVQVVNPVLILLFIPLFNSVVYPLLAKCHLLKTPLQRMTCGGFLAALAFAVSAGVSMAIEATDPKLPEGNIGHLRLYNPTTCDVTLNSQLFPGDKGNNFIIKTGEAYVNTEIKAGTYNFSIAAASCLKLGAAAKIFSVEIKGANMTAGYINSQGFKGPISDSIEKDNESGSPRIRILFSDSYTGELRKGDNVKVPVNSSYEDIISLSSPGKYKLDAQELELKLGGVYSILATVEGEKVTKVANIIVTDPNQVHMLWLMPQYIILTMAEIMFSITGLDFSYSQSPISMKSVLQAAFLLTDAIGNALIVVIEAIKPFKLASSNFFLYTALMVADMVLFGWMAYRYKYVQFHDEDSEEEESVDSDNNVLPKAIEAEGKHNKGFHED